MFPAHETPFCCRSPPDFIALFNGQDDLILVLFVALSAYLLRAGKPLAAGMALALFAASKFHLFTLVPLVLLAQRQWRMFACLAVSGSSALAISLAATSWSWPIGLYKLCTDTRASAGLDPMPNLHSLLAGAPFSFPIHLAIALA